MSSALVPTQTLQHMLTEQLAATLHSFWDMSRLRWKPSLDFGGPLDQHRDSAVIVGESAAT